MIDTAKSKTSWNLDRLFGKYSTKRITQELEEISKINTEFNIKWKKQRAYLKDPKVLKAALDGYEKIQQKHSTYGSVGYCMLLKQYLDQSNTKLKALNAKITETSLKLHNEQEFFLLNLSRVDKKQRDKFLNSKELAEYKEFLKDLFAVSDYLLSEQEEKILSLKSQPAHTNWVSLINQLYSNETAKIKDADGKTSTKSFAELISLFSDSDAKIRKNAAKKVDKILNKHIIVAETEINTILLNKKINDELRGLKKPDQSRHLQDNISTQIVETLVKSVEDSFDVSRQYYNLKAKLLNTEKISYYEKTMPVGTVDRKYKFEKAVEIVAKVFSDLDPYFEKQLETYLRLGKIDVYPKKNKVSGGFCVNTTKKSPSLILLNYTDKIYDVIALAHEMGHAINNELTKESQNALYCSVSIATAEVASTFFEDFVFENLLQKSTPEEKLILKMQKLDQEVSSVQRQIAFYKFETELHKVFREKGYLSHQEISSMFQEELYKYMGDIIDYTEASKNTWAYISHFRSFFYVYSYASGKLISKSLQQKAKKNPSFINTFKKFLGAGTSKSPRDMFEDMGLDISSKSFWEVGLSTMRESLEETTLLAKNLNKI